MPVSSSTYCWHDYLCSYTVHQPEIPSPSHQALLLIHPIGVGLSGAFWQRFIDNWFQQGQQGVIYNPDLLGCGSSAKPHVAYYPSDWAAQLKYLLEKVIQQPVILVVQGALLPVAIDLIHSSFSWPAIKGLVCSGPPAWQVITQGGKAGKQKVIWNLLFDSPVGLGQAFYLYARRRQFLKSFSIRQLFATAESVDNSWLNFLEKGAKDLDSRYAVFSFLAGFWRQDYGPAIMSIRQPTLVLVGDQASSISREGLKETPQQRLENYLKFLPNGQGQIISGRNVLPYESTRKFVSVVGEFVNQVA